MTENKWIYIDDFYFYVFYLVFVYNSFFGIRPLPHIHPVFCPCPYGSEVEFFFFFFFFFIFITTYTVRQIRYGTLHLFTCVVLRILIPTDTYSGHWTTEAENIYTNKHIWTFWRSMVLVGTFLRVWGSGGVGGGCWGCGGGGLEEIGP